MATAVKTIKKPTKKPTTKKTWVGKILKSSKAEVSASPAKPTVKSFMKDHGKFAEAYSMGVEFSLLTADNEAIHAFTYCKDFLSDVYWGSYFKSKASIYGFTYEPTDKNAPSMSPAKLLIRDKKNEKDITELALNCQAFINLWERALGFQEFTTCYPIEDHKCVFIESPAKEWTESLPMVSLWTLISRVGFSNFDRNSETADAPLFNVIKNLTESESVKSSPARDSGRLKTISGFLDKIERGAFKETFKAYDMESFKGASVGTIHNGSGIIATIGKCGGKQVY
jgi:hypothetical protein